MARDPLMTPLEDAGLDPAFLAKASRLGVRFAWQLLLYFPEGAPVGGLTRHPLGPWPRQCHAALLQLRVDPNERPSRDELRALYARSFPDGVPQRAPRGRRYQASVLARPIEEVDLSVRCEFNLRRAGVSQLWQLAQLDVEDLVRIGFPRPSANYMRNVMADYGLVLGFEFPAPLLAELQEIAPPLSPPAG